MNNSGDSSGSKPSIWWVRRDLRLRDNLALRECLEGGGPVIPLFILDPAILQSRSHGDAVRRRSFLFGGLRALDAELRARGSRLVVRRGEPARVLRDLIVETGAGLICAEEDFSPYARRRDGRVQRELSLRLIPGLTVHDPRNLTKPDGRPYVVFTAFRRKWESLPIPEHGGPRIPDRISTPARPRSDAIPEGEAPEGFPPGEGEGWPRLLEFLRDPILKYSTARNRLDLDGTSSLSPYFRFGMVSVREAARMARAIADGSGSPGAASWLNELAWRDFYISVLYHFPRVLRESFNPAFREIAWRRDRAALVAWRHGNTGYPVVDAGMRQLLASGWMHNRARMIVASFLVKDLLIDWREGERWFNRHLIDGDPAANDGGWQWAAGTGTDAAPYFRIFNPVTQGERFDPTGDYVRRWVPELSGLPAEWIHKPWQAPARVLREGGVKLGRTYPHPVVDHDAARRRALDVLATVRKG